MTGGSGKVLTSLGNDRLLHNDVLIGYISCPALILLLILKASMPTGKSNDGLNHETNTASQAEQ